MRFAAFFIALLLTFTGAFGQSWPKCSVRTRSSGGPAILINNQPFSPIFFVGNNQFGRDEVLFQEVAKAAAAGIALIGFNVRLDWLGSAEDAANTIDRFCNANPDAYFYLRVWIGGNAEWMKAHPDECVTVADVNGELKQIGYVSPASVLWREESRKMLQERLKQIVEGPHGDHFIGVGLENLQTAEWFYPSHEGFWDYSSCNLKAFRVWLKQKYKKEPALQKAWGNSSVTFETVSFPTPEQRDAAAWGPFRDPVKHRPAMDMERFQHELVADTIAYFAKAVKETTQGRSLVGVFYGYTMELNNNGPRALTQSGHLALDRLLDCRDVDILMAPVSYFERKAGQPGHFHSLIDSIALHGKLFVAEEDMYTHLAQEPPSGVIAPGWDQRAQSPGETLAVAWRDFGNVLTHGCGISFFDLLSDGRWSDETFWRSVPLMRRLMAEARGFKGFQPEVAFVVDENAVQHMKTDTYPLLIHSLSWWRAELDRLGTPVGYFLQSDLEMLPDSVKVVILADAFSVSREDRRLLNKMFSQGKTVVFNYAPDIVGPDGIDLNRIKALTGMAVEAKSDDVPMTLVSEFSGEEMVVDPQGWRPRLVVTEKGVDVVTRYRDTKEVCAAACKAGNGVSVYTAVPRLPVRVFREICRRAGVHLYRDTPGMTGICGNYLFTHSEGDVRHRFVWPSKALKAERLVPPSYFGFDLDEESAWSDQLAPGTTALYHILPKGIPDQRIPQLKEEF